VLTRPARSHVQLFTPTNQRTGKMSSYGARQLSATLGVQVLAFVVIFYWGHYSRHDMLFYIMIVYITIICPTWDIYKTNRKNLVQWRASFIRWKVGQERNEQMEYELAEAEASLEELHSKLQLTNEQMELIQANTDDLNALSGYAIDVEQELQVSERAKRGEERAKRDCGSNTAPNTLCSPARFTRPHALLARTRCWLGLCSHVPP